MALLPSEARRSKPRWLSGMVTTPGWSAKAKWITHVARISAWTNDFMFEASMLLDLDEDEHLKTKRGRYRSPV